MGLWSAAAVRGSGAWSGGGDFASASHQNATSPHVFLPIRESFSRANWPQVHRRADTKAERATRTRGNKEEGRRHVPSPGSVVGAGLLDRMSTPIESGPDGRRGGAVAPAREGHWY